MIVFLCIFIVAMIVGVPIAFAMLLAALYHATVTPGVDLIIIPQQIQDGLNSFPFMAIPFFILSGSLMAEAGVIRRFVDFAQSLIGHIRGGLSHAVVLAGAMMAGVSGSGTADAAALGSTMIPAMEKHGYDKRFAAAVTAFSGALGPIIPPSIFLIIYGAMGNVSIGQLFMAGIVPGVLMIVGLMVTAQIFIVRRGYGGTLARTTLVQKLVALRVAALDLVLPLGIIGGIRFGVFTPTEAGAVAVVYVLLTGVFVHRTLGWAEILKASRETVSILGSVMLLIAMATIVQYVLALYQASDHLGRYMASLSTSPMMFLLITNMALLFLGSLMEATAVLVLMTPILVPLLPRFGIDPVHYGMVLCLNMTIGLLTPPVGLAMFVTCAIAKITVEDFFRAAWPFFVTLVVLLLLLIAFPQISLWIPHAMMK